jgi:hypothetical protein
MFVIVGGKLGGRAGVLVAGGIAITTSRLAVESMA